MNTPTTPPLAAPSADPLLRAMSAVNHHLVSEGRPLDSEALCAYARARLLEGAAAYFAGLAELHPRHADDLLPVLDGFPEQLREAAAATARRISNDRDDAARAELAQDLREHPEDYVRPTAR